METTTILPRSLTTRADPPIPACRIRGCVDTADGAVLLAYAEPLIPLCAKHLRRVREIVAGLLHD